MITNAHYRDALPQLGKNVFITDGGLETVFVFQKQIDLPLFAAFHLLTTEAGIRELSDYYLPYIELAARKGTGVILDTATWRASYGWGSKLGYSKDDIRVFNQRSVALLEKVRAAHSTVATPMVINGAIGPEDDGYNPSRRLTADEAEAYHAHQVQAFANSAADMISAITMTYVDEAIGITRAALQADIPCAVSFTVETDGNLPDGTALPDAINAVDKATDWGPVYYMINCAHPEHFSHVLNDAGAWRKRIVGVRANASRKSHAELDEATELDEGNPRELGLLYASLKKLLPNLNVVGGCCGTDHRHVGAICEAIL